MPTLLDCSSGQRSTPVATAADFTVIIPTWNEEQYVAKAIVSARRAGAGEILVVDGGSDDATVSIAASLADRVYLAPRGRARQMNYGAERAGRDYLCFLHADCQLSPAALTEAARLLVRSKVVAGCFRQWHDSPIWHFRWLDAGANGRVRLLGLAYGDQGIFLRRDLFRSLGGFPEVPVFEDALLCRKLRRYGKLVLARAPILVSARRWLNRGFWPQTLRNWLLTFAFFSRLAFDSLTVTHKQQRRRPR